MTEQDERMEPTITKADSECMARGIVAMAAEIRAWLDTPETQARYKVWLAKRQEAEKQKEAVDSSHPVHRPIESP